MGRRAYDAVVDGGIPVTLPSGAKFAVLTRGEVEYLNERVERYLSDNHFINISDFQDVDRMLMLELFVFRWSLWLSRQSDYDGDDVDERALRASVSEYSGELRQLKKGLGIDKVARDKQKGDDSVATYIANLRRRAAEFGVMRSDQFSKVLELFQQMKALITLHDNCDEMERKEQHIQTDDILDWIRTVAVPEFDAIDEKFKREKQSMWIRQM